MRKVSSSRMAIAAVVAVMLLLTALAFLAVFFGSLTNSTDPVQVELHYPTPYPTDVVPPTATPIPTRVPTGSVRVRLAEHYDDIDGQAGADYQAGPAAFTVRDFAGHGGVGSGEDFITVPRCLVVGPPSEGGHDPAHGYPWTRYAIAWLASRPEPDHVIVAGYDQKPDFAVQTEDQSGTPQRVVMSIEGVDYNLMVSRNRMDCRMFEGGTWALDN